MLFQFGISDAKHIVIAIAGSVAGAIVGAIIKWLLDRRQIAELRSERELAWKERQKAFDERQRALEEKQNALNALVESQAEITKQREEIREKQDKLDSARRALNDKSTELAEAETKLANLLNTLNSNESGIWTSFDRTIPFSDYDSRISRRSPIILTVANLKGGVGKTTLVGNLIAFFDQRMGKRVLALDLDYQGSLTTMLRKERGPGARDSTINLLLTKGANASSLFLASRPLAPRLPRSSVVPAFYELALFEDRALVEWLIQQGGDDVRYRLAQVLLDEAVRQRYDIVLIDVPPRLTTGTINALCASTHVLVPTIFNPLAAEPVENFIRTSKLLMDKLNPKLSFVGVVETMTPPPTHGPDVRAEGKRMVAEALQSISPSLSILKNDVPRRTPLAEGDIGYLLPANQGGTEARRIFDALGAEIWDKLQ